MSDDVYTINCILVTDSPPINVNLSDDNILVDFTPQAPTVSSVEDVTYKGNSVVNDDHVAIIPIQPIEDILDTGQLNAVNSGITNAKVIAYDGYASQIEGKVDKVEGSRLMTNTEGNKLASIADNAQVNVIEGIKVNNTSQTPTDKIVNITVPIAGTDYLTPGTISETYVPKSVAQNATTEDKLVTQTFVNSSISTNTATFRGTFNIVTDLELPISATQQQIISKINEKVSVKTLNDYVFVSIPHDATIPTVIERYDRYKYSTDWAFEYTLNNSSFTSTQWDAINSGISSTKVGTYDGYQAQINNKANTSDLATVATSGSYADLTNKPTKLSQFENDTQFVNTSTFNGHANNTSNPHGFAFTQGTDYDYVKHDNKEIQVKSATCDGNGRTITSTYQEKLTAGTGISINNNVISNTQTSAEWGNISGTITNQADLMAILPTIEEVGF